jgi:hypothetical protein
MVVSGFEARYLQGIHFKVNPVDSPADGECRIELMFVPAAALKIDGQAEPRNTEYGVGLCLRAAIFMQHPYR